MRILLVTAAGSVSRPCISCRRRMPSPSLLGLVTSALILRHPVAGLCLLGFAVPWGSSLSLGGRSLPLTPTDLIAAEVGVAWLADAVLKRRNPIQDAILVPAIAFYLGAIAISVTQATDLAASAREVIKWLEFAEIFLASVWFLRSRLHLRLFVAALVGGGVSQAAAGVCAISPTSGPGGIRSTPCVFSLLRLIRPTEPIRGISQYGHSPCLRDGAEGRQTVGTSPVLVRDRGDGFRVAGKSVARGPAGSIRSSRRLMCVSLPRRCDRCSVCWSSPQSRLCLASRLGSYLPAQSRA